MRKQKKYHYIYRTTCQITGKFYVGMHSTDILEDEYLGSGKILGYSIGKHGRENHKKEIVEFFPDREALKLREKEVVNEELLADPLNINLKYGGEGGWDHITTTPFSKSEIQNSLAKRGGAKTAHLMKNDEAFASRVKSTISASMMGKQTFKGKKHSEESRKKISESMKKRAAMVKVVLTLV